jgi:regulator of sigma E protease
MELILTYILVVVAVVLMFGASIFVHELGHFLVALWRLMRVEAFAIGLGPKIWSQVRNGIEYSFRWIPAGGFVRLPQMFTSETLEGGAKNEAVPPAPPGSKILVAFAGPAMNVVFAFLVATVIYFVGLPVQVDPSIVGYVDPDSPEAKLGIQQGDRIVAVDGKRVNSWQDVQMNTAFARTNVIPVAVERDGVTNLYNLTAKVNDLVGIKLLNLDSKDHPVIVEVGRGSAAEKAGLKPDDQVLSFADVPVVGQKQLIGLIRKRPGLASEIQVQRAGQRLKLMVTPKFDPSTKNALLGVLLTPSSTVVYQLQKPGPTPWENVSGTLDMMVNTFSALFHHKETGIGAKDLSGPVGILSNMAVQVKTDYRLALNFLVLLNINLAILNLLPLPVLDGGHILMAIIEKIRRRPLNTKFVEYAYTGFAVLLISFMLYVTFFDFRRLPLFKSLLQHGSQIEEVSKPAPAESPAPAPVR